MKKLIAKFEDIMVAITFAESGEYEESMKLIEKIPAEEAERNETSKAMSSAKTPLYGSR